MARYRMTQIEDYEPLIGSENVERIREKAGRFKNLRVANSIEEAAECIVCLLKDEKLREAIGKKARETVRRKFLLTRYLKQYLDLFAAALPIQATK